MVVSQKDAVFNTVTKCRGEDGQFSRQAVIQEMVDMWKSGELDCPKSSDEAEVRTYCSSLISNWLRRDPRLSGANPVNATTRSPSSPRAPREPKQAKPTVDEQMKKLIAAKSILMKDKLPTDEIDQMITARQAQLDEARLAKKDAVMAQLKADLAEVGIDLDTPNNEVVNG